jgi:hypothetical protein
VEIFITYSSVRRQKLSLEMCFMRWKTKVLFHKKNIKDTMKDAKIFNFLKHFFDDSRKISTWDSIIYAKCNLTLGKPLLLHCWALKLTIVDFQETLWWGWEQIPSLGCFSVAHACFCKNIVWIKWAKQICWDEVKEKVRRSQIVFDYS